MNLGVCGQGGYNGALKRFTAPSEPSHGALRVVGSLQLTDLSPTH